MSVNDTNKLHLNETTDSVEDFFEPQRKKDRAMNLYVDIKNYMDMVLISVITLVIIYGVISWCFLKKFRNYRNFVLLNAITTNASILALGLILYNIESQPFASLWYHVQLALMFFTMNARSFWTLVICHMFYGDIVKVFNVRYRRRYLKSSLFGWGMALILTIIILIYIFLIETYLITTENYIYIIGIFLLCVPVILNCILYIVTVYNIVRSGMAGAHRGTKIWSRIYIATLIFLLSDVIMMSVLILQYFFVTTTFITIDSIILVGSIKYFLYSSNPLLLSIYFVVKKSNREVWKEFYVNKRNEWRRNRDIQLHMNVRSNRETVDRRPAV